MVDLGSLICLLSLAVQALKLGMLGFIIIGDVGRERRERELLARAGRQMLQLDC